MTRPFVIHAFGPFLAFLVWRLALWWLPDASALVLGMTTWMVTWWLQGKVPMAVVALLPLVVFPMLGVMSMKETAAPYGDPIVFLFLGGFLLGTALEKWQLHRRIALHILRWSGHQSSQIVLGFIVATALLSMWISNTATAMMMWPIAMSIIALLEKESGKSAAVLSKSLMLSVAYASSIGGMGTLIGTPPNTVMRGIVQQMTGYEIGFMDWMLLAMPLVLILLFLLYVLVTRICLQPEKLEGDVAKVVETEIEKLGPVSTAEKRVMGIFLVTALCWMFRALLNEILPVALDDTGIAIMAGVAMFLMPSGMEKGKPLLQWDDAQKVSWGIILLFGGGLSLAKGMEVSGLVGILGQTMADWSAGQVGFLVILFVVLGIFLTEVMSNVAMVNVLLPVVIALGLSLKTDVLQFAIPLTLASSCAFMLPMATPPNAVVFASGKLQIKDMMRVGLWLNLLAVLCILAWWWTLGEWVFKV